MRSSAAATAQILRIGESIHHVPVFWKDNGTDIDQPWLLSFITCAAPYAPAIGQQEAGDLFQSRIHRVLSIAKALGYSVLVLGAWGVVLLVMTRTARLSISGSLWRTTFEVHFPTSYSPSQISSWTGNISDPSVIFLL